MDSSFSFDSPSSSLPSLSSSPVLAFIYENFTYMIGIMVVIFGLLIYIHMADVTFEAPMTRTKRLIIETMEHKQGGKNDDDDDNSMGNNGDGGVSTAAATAAATATSENNLLTPPIDLEKKLKSGFCSMHTSKGSSATDIDNECKVFGKASCLNTDCCGWVVTANNPDGVCRSGSKTGMTFGYDAAGKKIDVDCYYYKDAKSGPRCSS